MPKNLTPQMLGRNRNTMPYNGQQKFYTRYCNLATMSNNWITKIVCRITRQQQYYAREQNNRNTMLDNWTSHNRNTMAENWRTEVLCRITGKQKYYDG